MVLATNTDELYFLTFSSTLKGLAIQWSNSLKPRSINSFDQLNKKFINMHDQPKPNTHLLTIKQRKDESLKDFVDRFNTKKLKCAMSFHRN